MVRSFAIAAGVGLLFGGSLAARSAPPPPAMAHIRGSVQSLKGSTLTVSSQSGPIRVILSPTARVTTIVRSDRSHIKPGSFLGITSVEQPNGSQKAVEIHVFPESMRGAGEGSYPWDWPGSGGGHSKMTNGTVSAAKPNARPHSRMTNGTVSGPAGASSLTLQYKSGAGTGSQALIIPPGIPIVTFAPGTLGDLKPGARVFVIGAKKPDGTVAAARVAVGKNGVAPPM